MIHNLQRIHENLEDMSMIHDLWVYEDFPATEAVVMKFYRDGERTSIRSVTFETARKHYRACLGIGYYPVD